MIGYHVCDSCYRVIESRGEPVINLMSMILEVFSLTHIAVGVQGKRKTIPILEYLEHSGYIVTTEFLDPLNNNRDSFLVIPKGCHLLDDECYYCFQNHGEDEDDAV